MTPVFDGTSADVRLDVRSDERHAGRERPLALCYGTRPQVIKASRLLPALRKMWDVVAVDTGQHYDYELNALLYEQLGVPRPDVLLGVGSAARLDQVSRIASECGRALRDMDAAAVVVLGDTNSTMGCALAAAQLQLPVVHVEAGLRSGVDAMAEEANRRLVDALSVLLCTPSESASARLHDEGLHGTVVCTGDVARDVLGFALEHAVLPLRPVEWPLPHDTPFVLATLHRAELVDDPDHLIDAFMAMKALPHDVVFAAHPRTRDRLRGLGLEGRASNVHVIGPLGYLETLGATRAAIAVVTDPGGLQREAYWLGAPCVTVRNETEWTETIACHANRLVAPGEARRALGQALAEAVAQRALDWSRDAYGTGDAAARIATAIAALPIAPELRSARG